nr:hypothetical protein [Candidatus Woesearchaeota archaeon]
MKKWIFLLMFLIVFISACENIDRINRNSIPNEVVKCGDEVCDSSESCDCRDCENDKRCFQQPKDNIGIVKESNLCGNDRCESEERCNLETYETICPEDCARQCPTKLVLTENNGNIFSCSGKCNLTDGRFLVYGNSKITAKIENIGERASNIVTSNFNCYTNGELLTRTDNSGNYGITVNDYFNNKEDEMDSINSRITGGNIANYTLEINLKNIVTTRNVDCSISIASVPDIQSTNWIYLRILK